MRFTVALATLLSEASLSVAASTIGTNNNNFLRNGKSHQQQKEDQQHEEQEEVSSEQRTTTLLGAMMMNNNNNINNNGGARRRSSFWKARLQKRKNGALSSSTLSNRFVECDPNNNNNNNNNNVDDVMDVGILNQCGSLEYCVESDQSSLGGYCMDHHHIHVGRQLQNDTEPPTLPTLEPTDETVAPTTAAPTAPLTFCEAYYGDREECTCEEDPASFSFRASCTYVEYCDYEVGPCDTTTTYTNTTTNVTTTESTYTVFCREGSFTYYGTTDGTVGFDVCTAVTSPADAAASYCLHYQYTFSEWPILPNTTVSYTLACQVDVNDVECNSCAFNNIIVNGSYVGQDGYIASFDCENTGLARSGTFDDEACNDLFDTDALTIKLWEPDDPASDFSCHSAMNSAIARDYFETPQCPSQ